MQRPGPTSIHVRYSTGIHSTGSLVDPVDGRSNDGQAFAEHVAAMDQRFQEVGRDLGGWERFGGEKVEEF